MGEAMKQADEGLKLFKSAEEIKTDLAAAEAFKVEADAEIAALEEEVAKLTGKDNKKERTAKSKQISDLKVKPQYIDACKVIKGLEPKNGFFVVQSSAPVPEQAKAAVPEAAATPAADAKKEPKKDEKKASKKTEGAGISPAERKELEQLKSDIIERKAKLKAEGLSGGQQNKDEQVMKWVARMNELKEKETPGSTQKEAKADKKKSSKAPLSSEEMKEVSALEGEIEVYKHRLKTEFGYSNKDIKADPELQEMEAKLAAFNKRSG